MTDSTDEDDIENVARLCPYCERPFEGEDGILSHLEQAAGQENHPEDIGETHTAEAFPRVELTEQGNVSRVLDEAGDIGTVATEKGAAVPVEHVYRLIAERIADRDRLTAHRVRNRLLGVEPPARPVRDDLTHLDVYNALLELGHGIEPDEELSATLFDDRIQIAVGETEGDYSADEALDLAASLESLANREDGGDEIAALVRFLRYAAELLEEGRSVSIPVIFRDWRDA